MLTTRVISRMMSNPLPKDLADCHALIEAQHELIEKLRHEIELFRRHIFGQRRERFVVSTTSSTTPRHASAS